MEYLGLNHQSQSFILLIKVKMPIVKKRNEKSYQVQAFCEERGLAPSLGVIW